mmetsp:Transcript_107497/g.286016  ORF Transcript_107497/g.286016 Transcript_107497/m.286016 type:complete len:248 (+) Transcript_107497:242-985(+)
MQASCIHQASGPREANSAFVVRTLPSSLLALFMHFQQMPSKQPAYVPSGRFRPQYTPPFSMTALSHFEHFALSGSQPMRVSSFFGSGSGGGSGFAMPCSFSHTCILSADLSCSGGLDFRRGLRLRSRGSGAGGSSRGGFDGLCGGAGVVKVLPRFSAACWRSSWLSARGMEIGKSSSEEESSSIASSVAETSHLPLSATRTSVTFTSEPSITDCAKASRRSWCSGAGLSQTGQHQACFGGIFLMVCM